MSADETAQWIAKAEEDWSVSHHLRARDAQGFANTICYHAQQCAEKYLKALIVKSGGTPPRIHHLPALLEAVAGQWPALAAVRGDCETLTPFAFGFRYPGEDATPQDVTTAISAVARVRIALREALGVNEKR